MSKNDNISIAFLVVVGLIIALANCDSGSGGRSSIRSHQSVSSRSNSHQVALRAQQQKDDMIRRVNGIIENIGSAGQRLQAKEKAIREEKDALERVKQNARTAHLGGQMRDFRMWQCIGREKKANIERALTKAENTISEAWRGAESKLQRVNWISDGEKNSHLGRINQRLSQLCTWASTLEQMSDDLAQHTTWLEASE